MLCTVTLADIEAARARIRGGVLLTPCPESVALSELTGCRIFCKLDNLQRTGSFKERGARNALLQLPGAQKRAGVISASAGNHALGLAYHGRLLGIPIKVVMPQYAPLIKVASCRRLGAEVVLRGANYAEARAHAQAEASAEGMTYIHGYDDPGVIEGQGTMALEILEQVPDADALVVPVGGAGLLAGVCVAAKGIRKDILVLGVESEAAPTFTRAMAAGEPVAIDVQPSLADGLSVPDVGALAFSLARPLTDAWCTVSEEEIALAILRLVELEKGVVEGAAASCLAACLAGKFPQIAGKKVVLLLCGGNIDPAVLSRVIEQGLVADGRLCRFTAIISDRPGGLAELAGLIAATGASVREILHDRAFSGPDISIVKAVCTVETRDRAHLDELRTAVREHFPCAFSGQ